MQPFQRKILVVLVAVSLAAAGGFVPKHAHAKGAAGHHAAGSHSHGAGADRGHHHTSGPQGHAKAEAGPDCHKDVAPVEADGTPMMNCCIASCSAIALIFADSALPERSWVGSVFASKPDAPAPVARTSDDPPPR
jgi:hypothetical protein